MGERYKFRIIARLKEGINDPQGLAVKSVLPQLGHDEVTGVRIGKVFEVILETDDAKDMRRRLEEVAKNKTLFENSVLYNHKVTYRKLRRPKTT